MKNSNAMEVDAVNRGKGNSSTSISQRWPWIQACSQEGEDEEWGHWEEHWEDKEQGQVHPCQQRLERSICSIRADKQIITKGRTQWACQGREGMLQTRAKT